MNRKEFIKTCTLGCVSMAVMQSCSTTQLVNAVINGSDILVPLRDFEISIKDKLSYKKQVIVQHNLLQHPICVTRFSATEYTAVLLKCTHQGAELQAFGDKFQCPAHGSEFSNKGLVESGPAVDNLRIFPITIEANQLKISLK